MPGRNVRAVGVTGVLTATVIKIIVSVALLTFYAVKKDLLHFITFFSILLQKAAETQNNREISMAFTIQKAQGKDSPLILDFIKLLAKYEKLEHQVTATAVQIEKTIFKGNSNVEVYIGYEDETPVSFMLFFLNYSTFLAKPGIYLEDLFVKGEYRGKGYGKKMLHFLAGIALERNCGRLEWAVLDWNKPARDFYESIGAQSMDSWIINRLSGSSLEDLANLDIES